MIPYKKQKVDTKTAFTSIFSFLSDFHHKIERENILFDSLKQRKRDDYMKVIIVGALGRMGREVTSLAGELEDIEISAKVDILGDSKSCLTDISLFTEEADVIIDFSKGSNSENVINYALKRKIPLVIASTGQSEKVKEKMKKASETIPLLYSENMSFGIVVIKKLISDTIDMLPISTDVEIIETHHKHKEDFPSGTALMLLRALKTKLKETENKNRISENIGVHSIRRGNISGIHEVIFSSENETLSIKHEVHSRKVFAQGVIYASRFLADKQSGLFTMDDLLK